MTAEPTFDARERRQLSHAAATSRLDERDPRCMIIDGYVRVSQVKGRSGDSFMSPKLQREQIERWAAAQGHRVAVVHEELDESGGRADRPLLAEAIERIEAGVVDGVAVAKLDRFGRSLVDGLGNIERIRQAGGTFISVQDGLDLTTDTGKLVLRIMLSMAEWELDRIRSTWDNAKRRATERSMHLASVPPFGYRHGPERRLRPNLEQAPYLIEIFKRRGAGATIADLSSFLEGDGIRTSFGSIGWKPASVAAVLRNRVYLGELRNGQHLKLDAHRALVDEATWQAAQKPRMVGPRFRNSEPTLSSGLVRCAGCGLAMQSAWRAGKERTYRDYCCGGLSSGGHCESRARARGWELEHVIEEAFFTLARQQPRTRPSADPRMAAKLKQAQADLVAYRDHPALLLRLGPARFEAGIDARLARVERAALDVANDRARFQARRELGRSAEGWERAWPALSVDERRQAVAQLIDCVFVARGDGPLAERAWICARGTAPHSLPSRGRGTKALMRFDPRRQPTVTITPAPLWSGDRVHWELANYVDGCEDWPSDQQFLTDGRGPLLRQIDRRGGQDAWARRVGARWHKTTARDGYWIDERIRASLEEIMCTRDEWPFAYEWVAIAPDGLGAVIETRHQWWAGQLGYRLQRQYRPKRWTRKAMEEAVRELVKTTRTYPTQKQFGEARLSGLELMIRRHHGHRAFCEALDLQPCSRTAAHWGP